MTMTVPTPSAATIDPLELLSGMLADAHLLVEGGRAAIADVDTAMQLGAGYPKGPFAVLADLSIEEAAQFGTPPASAASGAATSDADTGWAGPIGLVGTGTMAGGIAEAIARTGRTVVVLYRSEASYEAMVMRIAGSLARSVEKGRFTAADGDRFLGNITMTNDARRLAGCDLVIEAVKEELGIKRATFALLDAALPAGVPIATNTSSYRVADVAVSGRPVFAMHFFNPAQAMKLVELVFPEHIDATLRATARGFVRSIGKVSVDCADTRGFVVNRLLLPFLNDAVRAHETGASVEAIDLAMTERFEHPMGPFALIDMIGLDVMVLALEAMAETEGDPRIAPADTFRRYVGEGRLGRKSGRGFYEYGTPK